MISKLAADLPLSGTSVMLDKLLWSIPLRVCEYSIFFPLEHNNGGRVCLVTYHTKGYNYNPLSRTVGATIKDECGRLYPGITLSWGDAI